MWLIMSCRPILSSHRNNRCKAVNCNCIWLWPSSVCVQNIHNMVTVWYHTHGITVPYIMYGQHWAVTHLLKKWVHSNCNSTQPEISCTHKEWYTFQLKHNMDTGQVNLEPNPWIWVWHLDKFFCRYTCKFTGNLFINLHPQIQVWILRDYTGQIVGTWMSAHIHVMLYLWPSNWSPNTPIQ